MKKLISVLIILSSIYVFGCAAEEPSPESDQPSSESPKSQNDAPQSSDDKQEAGDAQKTEKLRTYLRDNFGAPGYETSWYKQITNTEISDDTVKAETKLSSSSKEEAKGVCGGLSGFAYSSENEDMGIKKVEVYSADGELIINRSDVTDGCE